MERWDGRVAVVCDFAGSPTGLAICRDLVTHGLTVIGLTLGDSMPELQASRKLKTISVTVKENFLIF